jgi:hypothetical protein
VCPSLPPTFRIPEVPTGRPRMETVVGDGQRDPPQALDVQAPKNFCHQQLEHEGGAHWCHLPLGHAGDHEPLPHVLNNQKKRERAPPRRFCDNDEEKRKAKRKRELMESMGRTRTTAPPKASAKSAGRAKRLKGSRKYQAIGAKSADSLKRPIADEPSGYVNHDQITYRKQLA